MKLRQKWYRFSETREAVAHAVEMTQDPEYAYWASLDEFGRFEPRSRMHIYAEAAMDVFRAAFSAIRCDLFGHDYREVNADPENGGFEMECQRCGMIARGYF